MHLKKTQGIMESQAWWHTSSIPVHRRQRQKYLCKFEDSQGYTVRPHLKDKKEMKERRKEQAKHGGSATNPSTQKLGRL